MTTSGRNIDGTGYAHAGVPGNPSGGQLSVFDIACVVIGGIIGVGIFFTPGTVASRVQSSTEVVLAWSIGGVLAALGALVFAGLSQRVPGHGGMFRYVLAAFGRGPAFLYGWTNWLVIQAGALSVVSLFCVKHIERALFGVPVATPGLRVALAAALILSLTATNLLGLRVGKRVQNALVALKVLCLCLLVAAALLVTVAPLPMRADAAPRELADSALARLAGALLPVLFAIGGWQQGSFVAGAARRPRDVPFGILIGVAIVIGVYLAINLAYLAVLGFDGAARSEAIGADTAAAVFGHGGERVFAAMAALSAAGILNTICLAPPYVLLTMAQEGLLPRAFARCRSDGTPFVGVLAQGLWATVLLVGAFGLALLQSAGDDAVHATERTLEFVCDGVVFADWVFFTLCGLSLLRLCRAGAVASRATMLVAAAFALCALGVTVAAIVRYPQPSLAGLAVMLLGLPAFAWFGRRRP